MIEIKKVLIANRGEIAIRIMKTLSSMEIVSVAIYAYDDKDSFFITQADESVLLKGAGLTETYLNQEQIIQIALETNCDAIHPGYGFLSENATFAQACEGAGLIFIGPPIEAIKLMGDKVASRNFAEQHHVPLLKGITGNQEELLQKKDELHYPVIIKASAGGGGKGMRVVAHPDDLESTLISTSREAKSYFGNGEVFIERFIENPRHIEVQVLGDQHGNMIHLFERECTIQRRHQKIIEEAPSITLNNEQRSKITEAAIQLAKSANYYSAGTVEFIVDEDLNFYFMEMNTRIQVEHPVTELITDVDIVEQQIKVAQGLPLSFSQEDISIDGHSIECRIYAEDPAENFRPSPGTITYYSQPDVEFTRIDSSFQGAQPVSDRYDPMIAKLVTWGETRSDALQHMSEALGEYVIEGIPQNIEFLQSVIHDPLFRNNEITTNYCKTYTTDLLKQFQEEKSSVPDIIPILAFILQDFHIEKQDQSIWEKIGYFQQVMSIPLQIDGKEILLETFNANENGLSFILDGKLVNSKVLDIDDKGIEFTWNESVIYCDYRILSKNKKIIIFEGFKFKIKRLDVLGESDDYDAIQNDEQTEDTIISPIPGTVIDIFYKEGDEVKENQVLLIVEAMKMENGLSLNKAGIIDKILVKKGDKVQADQLLLSLKKEES